MALRNKNYVEPSPHREVPAVSTPPTQGAELPPPVENQPPELPPTESPADLAAKAALKQRLAEMERADELSKNKLNGQRPPQPELPTQQQEPRSAEEIISSAAIPDVAKNWLRQRPEYVLDPIKNDHLVKASALAAAQTGQEFTPLYFERMESLLDLRREPQSRPPSGGGPTSAHSQPQPRPSAPPRQQRLSMPVSAPPTREVPSMTTGRPQSHRAPLTKDELEIAQASGITPERYAQEKAKMMWMKEKGLLDDRR